LVAGARVAQHRRPINNAANFVVQSKPFDQPPDGVDLCLDQSTGHTRVGHARCRTALGRSGGTVDRLCRIQPRHGVVLQSFQNDLYRRRPGSGDSASSAIGSHRFPRLWACLVPVADQQCPYRVELLQHRNPPTASTESLNPAGASKRFNVLTIRIGADPREFAVEVLSFCFRCSPVPVLLWLCFDRASIFMRAG